MHKAYTMPRKLNAQQSEPQWAGLERACELINPPPRPLFNTRWARVASVSRQSVFIGKQCPKGNVLQIFVVQSCDRI